MLTHAISQQWEVGAGLELTAGPPTGVVHQVVYVMLCGRPPFWDKSQPRMFKKIQSAPLEFP